MNFFEHEEHARRRTATYLLLFALAAVVVVSSTDVAVLLIGYVLDDKGSRMPFGVWVRGHPSAVWWITIMVCGAIAGASLYRMASLAGGGARVATELGGTRIDASTQDPPKRQLLNVVEEMALAAGMPVPEVYVLDKEDGINAFAVGFGAADAAIAVTHGALTRLTRDELQGVVGHELSHVLNGDTRLNTQLIGALYGITAIGLFGGLMLRSTRSSNDTRFAAAVFLPGFILMIVGYLGLFCGRLIQSAVSRSREALADACAVQFTRNPAGLASALKKIAVAPIQGVLLTNCDEVNHMLIVDGRKLYDQFFATHPPLLERIKALDPYFDPAELAHIKLPPVETRPPAVRAAATFTPLSPAAVVASIGQPDVHQLEAAVGRQSAIPETLRGVAYSRTYAPTLVLALALNKDPAERAHQIDRLHKRVPESYLTRLDAVVALMASLPPEQRLPLVAIAFPALRQRSSSELQTLVAVVEEIERMDGRFDCLDYTLVRMLRIQLTEAASPSMMSIGIAPKLSALSDETGVLFSVVAQAGNSDGIAARNSYEAGMRVLSGATVRRYAPPQPWIVPLDRALTRLDALAPASKQRLIEALVTTILHDRRVTLGELELLRVICASLHCPVPPLDIAAGGDAKKNETSPPRLEVSAGSDADSV